MQLNSTLIKNNFFDRSRSILLVSIFVRENTNNIKLYKLNCIIDKRSIVYRDIKYLVR